MGRLPARKPIGGADMTKSKLIALAIWEAVGDIDRIDETPHGQVSALLDEISAKLTRAAIAADELAKEPTA